MTRAGLVGLALVVALPIGAGAQTSLPTARVDSVFLEFNRTDRPGCSLAIFRQGELAYARGYGMANLEYGIALQPRSVFHIASISKQFAAFAVELLVSENEVSWDDDIRRYVPEIPDYGHPITLRHLVHHTSGIRDQWDLLSAAGWRWQADLVTHGDAIHILSRQQALNFAPGEEYLYSNSGFTLLAAVVQAVTGQTLRRFAQERIFAPLKMTSTHFHDDHEPIVPDRAYGYRYQADEGWKISIPDFAIVGASSLFTTVEDMAKWDRSLRDRTLGDTALYERFFSRGVLTTGDTLDYAHGIVVSTYRGLPTVGHGGADAGYRTNYLRFPEQDVGIVCFCNFAAANPGRYVRQVADIVLADALAPEPVADARPKVDRAKWERTLEGIAGFYRDPRMDQPLHVWVHRGSAYLTRGLGRDSAGQFVVPLGSDRFKLWGSEEEFTLERRDGKVEALHLARVRYSYVAPPATAPERGDYLGTYWSDELGTEYRVELDSAAADGLVLRHRKQDPAPMRATFPDGFTAGGRAVTFERDATGQVVGFTWSSGRVRKVRFTRR